MLRYLHLVVCSNDHRDKLVLCFLVSILCFVSELFDYCSCVCFPKSMSLCKQKLCYGVDQAYGIDYFMLSIFSLDDILLGVFEQRLQGESIDRFAEGEYRYAQDFSLTHGFGFPEFPLLLFKLHAIFHVSKYI